MALVPVNEVYYKMSLVLLLLLFLVSVQTNKIPSFVHLCKRNDPQLGECIKNTAHELRPYLAKGIPELGLIPADPLKISNINLHVGEASLSVDLNLTDVSLHDISNFNITYCSARLEQGRFTAKLWLEKIRLEAQYHIKGTILTFVIDGKGPTTFNATGLSIHAEWFGKMIDKNGRQHLKFDEINCKVDIESMQLYGYNLFEGNEALTDTVNKVMNDNIQELKTELDLIIQKVIGDIALDYFNAIYDRYPLDELFLSD